MLSHVTYQGCFEGLGGLSVHRSHVHSAVSPSDAPHTPVLLAVGLEAPPLAFHACRAASHARSECTALQWDDHWGQLDAIASQTKQ